MTGNRRETRILLAIALVAAAIRLFLVLHSVWLWDEDREWVILARSISLEPGAVHLPIHGDTHPILPAYFMRAGTLLFGETLLGFRLLSVVAGALTVFLAGRIASRVAGLPAGIATAVLLALNEYHVAISSVAVDMVFYLSFVALALGSFERFLASPRADSLILVGLFAGLGFLCNERAGLLVPLLAAGLLLTGNAVWLRRWPAWAAIGVFLLVVSPELLKGLLVDSGATRGGLGDHLERLAGLRPTYQPAAFFGKGLVAWVLSVVGIAFKDWAPEYAGMNEGFGIALGLAALFLFLSPRERAVPIVRSCLAFVLVAFTFLFFLGTKYNPEKELGPQAWYWADLLLLPSALLLGVAVTRLAGWRRVVLVSLLVAGAGVASWRISVDRLGLPKMKAAASPEVLTPADGRWVEVRAEFVFCTLCDPEPWVELARVEVEARNGLREPRAEELEEIEGGAGRRFRIRALPGTEFYGLHWVARGADGRESPLSTYVLVRDEPRKYHAPFWLTPPASEGARGLRAPGSPSRSRAGGS